LFNCNERQPTRQWNDQMKNNFNMNSIWTSPTYSEKYWNNSNFKLYCYNFLFSCYWVRWCLLLHENVCPYST
jgi:hypothetical protein